VDAGVREESVTQCGNAGLIRAFRAVCHIDESSDADLRIFRPFPVRPASLMRLRAENIGCQRGGRDVFAGLNFTLRAGEALLVTGRNGAGKSSLLRLVAGLVRLTTGRLVLDGADPEAGIGEQAHYLGHQDAVKTALTVAENLTFWRDYLGGTGNVSKALEAVGLAPLADLPAAYLSAGQRRRLSVARLIAVKRPLWLLDEPTSALDASAQRGLARLMQLHLKSGGLILAASHGPVGLPRARELRMGAP
jgi:heme exporter protein A